jgi:hypothetical protein
VEFFGDEDPPYAALSHTWVLNEVTFKEIDRNGYKFGSIKIDGCCRQALNDGLEYVWIDTCCIDKSSSAELSEGDQLYVVMVPGGKSLLCIPF